LRLTHGVVAEVVRRTIAAGKVASDVTPELVRTVAAEVAGTRVELSDESLRACLDPHHFVRVHNSDGGVSPSSVARMIAQRRAGLEQVRSRHNERLRKQLDAETMLAAAVRDFVG
jgi:argininosuccinate lyase